MDINIFGIKLNLLVVAFSLIIGIIIGAITLCSCTTVTFETKKKVAQELNKFQEKFY